MCKCKGHQPYLANCASCVCARGRIPARRVRLPQKEYKVIGLDFLFFGKFRVLLLVHTATRYTFAFPVQDPDSVEQDVVSTFGKFVREIGLQKGVVTLRCDNEAFLIKICGILAKKPQPCERHTVNLLIVLPCLGFEFVAGISSHFPKTFLAIFVGNVHTDLHDSSVNLRVLACRCPCPQHELLCTCHATCIRAARMAQKASKILASLQVCNDCLQLRNPSRP